MREIKFRAWSNDFSKMVYPNEKGWFESCFIGENHFTQHCQLDVAIDKNGTKLELMQYTGLKDRNGKEIYESDIVKVFDSGIHFDPENYDIYKVHWSQFGWTPFVARGCKWTSYFGEIKEFEVIGNIYENPELLEK